MFDIAFDENSVRQPARRQLALLASASEMDLRYGYFQANLTVSAGEFDDELCGVTLVDFMFCLLYAVQGIREGGTGEVGFTESDQIIEFIPKGDLILMKKTWDPEVWIIDRGEFFTTSKKFCDDVLKFISREYPDFIANSVYSKLANLFRGVQP
jgi:hypothetical protein